MEKRWKNEFTNLLKENCKDSIVVIDNVVSELISFAVGWKSVLESSKLFDLWLIDNNR